MSIEFDIDEALSAYELLDDSTKLGILIKYPNSKGNNLGKLGKRTLTLNTNNAGIGFTVSAIISSESATN